MAAASASWLNFLYASTIFAISSEVNLEVGTDTSLFAAFHSFFRVLMSERRSSRALLESFRLLRTILSSASGAKPDQEEVPEINEAGIVFMAALEGLGGEKALPALPSTDISKALVEHAQRLGQPGDDWRRFREITGEVEVN
jgi:hypothetical protein